MESKLPIHIGIILDGNRRWARSRGLPEYKGHEEGAKNIMKIIEKCINLGIKIITLYVFSMENFNRSEEEKRHLFRIFKKMFREFPNKKEVIENKIRISAFGRTYLFPDDVQEALNYAIEKTKEYDNFFLNLCIGYDGRDEIVDAVKEICKKVVEGKIKIKDINRDTIKSHLYTRKFPPPDLIIRTGMKKERRLSGFLLWDSSYSEFYFTSTLWPDFSEEELLKALEDFSERERRFGR